MWAVGKVITAIQDVNHCDWCDDDENVAMVTAAIDKFQPLSTAIATFKHTLCEFELDAKKIGNYLKDFISRNIKQEFQRVRATHSNFCVLSLHYYILS